MFFGDRLETHADSCCGHPFAGRLIGRVRGAAGSKTPRGEACSGDRGGLVL